jgi:hypothetical protein
VSTFLLSILKYFCLLLPSLKLLRSVYSSRKVRRQGVIQHERCKRSNPLFIPCLSFSFGVLSLFFQTHNVGARTQAGARQIEVGKENDMTSRLPVLEKIIGH